MNKELLRALNAARASKKRAALIRDLQGGETLWIEGEAPLGAPIADDLIEAIAADRDDRSAMVERDGGALFVQRFEPPSRLFVIGGVHISQHLAPIAQRLGYAATIVDPRGFFATPERFPEVPIVDLWPDEALEEAALDRRSAVVALTHDPKLDDPALDVALRSEAFYVAALGSKKNAIARKERLAEMGHDETALARISGPAGLDIGAKSPAEIAISIAAEMVRAARKPL